MNRLAQFEDLIIGQQAQTALSNSQMVGTETFTAKLNSKTRWSGFDSKRPWSLTFSFGRANQQPALVY